MEYRSSWSEERERRPEEENLRKETSDLRSTTLRYNKVDSSLPVESLEDVVELKAERQPQLEDPEGGEGDEENGGDDEDGVVGKGPHGVVHQEAEGPGREEPGKLLQGTVDGT